MRSSENTWLFSQLRPFLKGHVTALVMSILVSAISLTDPLIMRWAIDVLLPRRSYSGLLTAVACILAAYVARVALVKWSMYLTFDAYHKLVFELRLALLKRLGKLSADFHEKTRIGEKQYVFLKAIDDVAVVAGEQIPAIIRHSTIAITVTIIIILLAHRLAIILIPITVAYLVCQRIFRARVRRASDNAAKAVERMSVASEEHLRAMIQLQLLRAEKYQLRKSFHTMAEMRRAQESRVREEMRLSMVSNCITVLGTASVLVVGGSEVLAGIMTVGGLVACYSYLSRLYEPLTSLASILGDYNRCRPSILKVRELLAVESSVTEPRVPRLLVSSGRALSLRFSQVSFGYSANSRQIEGIELNADSGQRLALVGPNGAGKSTILKLAARLYDPSSGAIFINGSDIRELRLGNLRKEVLYVTQTTVLFDGTVEENLRYGARYATPAQLDRAIHVSGLDATLSKLRQGLQSEIGAAGEQLSGGERQKIALARAVLRSPRLMLLDEATGALDATSERSVLEKLDKELGDCTLLLVSHRLASISWVQKIAVVEAGRLLAIGTHGDLYNCNDLYRRLYEDQVIGSHPLVEAARH